VANFDPRSGIQGTSEVSEEQTAVYRYERSINSTGAGDTNDDDGSDTSGRLFYVGLSDSFGTVTVGKVWGAAYNHFGAIVDQANWYGSTGTIEDIAGGTGLRFGEAVSYAVSIGDVSLQAEAIMDQSTGKTGNEFGFGATLGGPMETGSVAIAHRKHQDLGTLSESSSYIAGNFGIGDMIIFLGYSQDSRDDST